MLSHGIYLKHDRGVLLCNGVMQDAMIASIITHQYFVFRVPISLAMKRSELAQKTTMTINDGYLLGRITALMAHY